MHKHAACGAGAQRDVDIDDARAGRVQDHLKHGAGGRHLELALSVQGHGVWSVAQPHPGTGVQQLRVGDRDGPYQAGRHGREHGTITLSHNDVRAGHGAGGLWEEETAQAAHADLGGSDAR